MRLAATAVAKLPNWLPRLPDVHIGGLLLQIECQSTLRRGGESYFSYSRNCAGKDLLVYYYHNCIRMIREEDY